MKINWYKSILAGLIGTILFDLLGLILTGQWWDIPSLLGAKLGVGLTGGVLGHYANGAAIAVIYAAMRPSLFGPNWFRGVSFITAQTVLGVWLFMLPLLGAGIAGIDANPMLPIISLSRHLLYAVPLIIILRPQAAETSSSVQCAVA
jgi:hypothetical protein